MLLVATVLLHSMLLNIGLLILVFAAQKKKLSPWLAGFAFGAVKGAIYAVVTRHIVFALVMGLIFAGLTTLFAHLLRRADRRETAAAPDTPAYTVGGSDKMTFRWEYIPITILLLIIVGGEMLLRW